MLREHHHHVAARRGDDLESVGQQAHHVRSGAVRKDIGHVDGHPRPDAGRGQNAPQGGEQARHLGAVHTAAHPDSHRICDRDAVPEGIDDALLPRGRIDDDHVAARSELQRVLIPPHRRPVGVQAHHAPESAAACRPEPACPQESELTTRGGEPVGSLRPAGVHPVPVARRRRVPRPREAAPGPRPWRRVRAPRPAPAPRAAR